MVLISKETTIQFEGFMKSAACCSKKTANCKHLLVFELTACTNTTRTDCLSSSRQGFFKLNLLTYYVCSTRWLSQSSNLNLFTTKTSVMWPWSCYYFHPDTTYLKLYNCSVVAPWCYFRVTKYKKECSLNKEILTNHWLQLFFSWNPRSSST